MGRVKKIIKIYLIIAGIVVNVFIVWMVAGLPIFFDGFLVKSEKPIESKAIICIAGGISGNNLPTRERWERIYTAVQLYFDDYAPKIVFTGGGVEKITEAEIYAEAARWLGCPKEAISFCPKANNTAQHPSCILNAEDIDIDRSTPLNIVTSSLHSKRTWMGFKKAGFHNFRMVTGYTSQKQDADIVRKLMTSRFKDFKPCDKKYNDIFMRLRRNISYFFRAAREMAGILYYEYKGYV